MRKTVEMVAFACIFARIFIQCNLHGKAIPRLGGGSERGVELLEVLFSHRAPDLLEVAHVQRERQRVLVGHLDLVAHAVKVGALDLDGLALGGGGVHARGHRLAHRPVRRLQVDPPIQRSHAPPAPTPHLEKKQRLLDVTRRFETAGRWRFWWFLKQ